MTWCKEDRHFLETTFVPVANTHSVWPYSTLPCVLEEKSFMSVANQNRLLFEDVETEMSRAFDERLTKPEYSY